MKLKTKNKKQFPMKTLAQMSKGTVFIDSGGDVCIRGQINGRVDDDDDSEEEPAVIYVMKLDTGHILQVPHNSDQKYRYDNNAELHTDLL